MSDWARQVMQSELGLKPSDLERHVKKVYADTDLAAPFASGSNRYDALVIVPCSVSTLAKIATGIADTLITRAAAVAMKERMKMVVCVRETPLSSIAIRNMLTLSREGVVVMPISPPWYRNPTSLEELVRGFTDKLLGVLGERRGRRRSRGCRRAGVLSAGARQPLDLRASLHGGVPGDRWFHHPVLRCHHRHRGGAECVETLSGRSYVVEHDVETYGPDTFEQWVRMRQDASGLYEADVATNTPAYCATRPIEVAGRSGSMRTGCADRGTPRGGRVQPRRAECAAGCVGSHS